MEPYYIENTKSAVDSSLIEVSRSTGDDKSDWDSFVESSPTATISHLYGWRNIISASYGHDSFYLIARLGNKVAGILPLIWLKNRVFGRVLASMPFQDYGGIAAHDDAIARALLEPALQLTEECGAVRLELRHKEPLLGFGRVREDKAVLVLDISAGSGDLWKRFGPKVRNQVRKAEKSSLHAQMGRAELLEEFYHVFTVNMRDLGSPVHHPSFFSNIFSQFGDKAVLFLAKEGSRTVGGLVCLFHKGIAVVPWASSLRECFSKCPNNLLYWEAIRHACERGCKFFDFGRSTIGSGTYNFKLQWGAKPFLLHWQLYPEDGNLHSDPSATAKYRFFASVWKHMPLALTTWLGPHIRKHLAN
jgi:FemAB-related protein (PEP-CTERM system-associated)